MGKRKFDSNVQASKKSKITEESVTEHEDTTAHNLNDDDKTRNFVKNSRNFDIKHFRKELAVKQGQTIALTQFLQVCLNPENEVDYLSLYLESGGSSHEILRQVSEDERKNLTLATPAFHIFHLIILKVQQTHPRLLSITEEACRYFLNNFMSTVEIMISENSGPRHRKIILKLFTSMVTLNPDLGIEILNQAPLSTKNLQYILEKPNYKEKDNVRTAFVHFVTSFLVEGHLPLMKALLDKPGILHLVIPGLVNDHADAVIILLNILKKNVIENVLISKTLKLKTFNHNVLNQLFKIFNWKGPTEDGDKTLVQYKEEISSLLTDILLTLFTSNKTGIYFNDLHLGTSEANKNQNLYKALLSLKRPWENKAECDVLLEIVFRCPDLHRAVISLIENSFEPQHSPIWERTTTFFLKLLNKLNPERMVNRFTCLSPGQVANFVRFTTLPVPLLKYINLSFGKCDYTVSLYCIKLLVKMLNSLKQYKHILEMDNSSLHTDELKNKMEYFFPKHLPSPLIVANLIKQSIEDNKKSQALTGQEYALPKFSDVENMILLIELLLLYNQLHPAHFETLEGNIDLKQLSSYIDSLTGPEIPLLKFKLVSLWLTLDSSAVSLKNPMFKDLFLIMLQVYTSVNDDTWIEAKETIHKFIQNTSIFETDEDEIHILLYSLRNSDVDAASVSDALEYVIENINELSEQVRKQTIDLISHKVNEDENIEVVFQNLIEGKIVDGDDYLDHKIPSPFIVGCIQFMDDNKEAKKKLKHFLSVYTTNLFHCNLNPELTDSLISDVKLDVKGYIASWNTEPVMLNKIIIGKDEVLRNISSTVLTGDSCEITNIFHFIDKITDLEDISEFITISDKYKLRKTNIDGSELLIWSKYLVFCTVRLAVMSKLTSAIQSIITDLFDLLLEICKKKHIFGVSFQLLRNIFKNSYLLNIFTPVDNNKSEHNVLATQFLLSVVTKHLNTLKAINMNSTILKPFQQKTFNQLSKVLKKPKKIKNINSSITVKVLQVIGMTKHNDFTIMNKIFELDQAHFVREDKEPSLMLEILSVIISKYALNQSDDLTANIIDKIMNLYADLIHNNEVQSNLTNMEIALIAYFEHKPYHIRHVSKEHYKKCFFVNTTRKTTSQLGACILKVNQKLCTVFKEEMTNSEVLALREITLPLGTAIIRHKKFFTENKELCNTIYKEYKANIYKMIEKPHKAGQIYFTCWKFIRKLLIECAEFQDCDKVFNKILKFELADANHLHLYHDVFLKMCTFENGQSKHHLINYILSVLNAVTFAMKERKPFEVINEMLADVYNVAEVSKTIKQLNTKQKQDFQKLTENAIWQNFCKTVLKDSLKLKTEIEDDNSGAKSLYLLTTLVKLLYPENHEDITTLFDMVTSHSEFLKVMLSHSSIEIKSRLIEFLFVLIMKNNSIMKPQQIPVYLSAYHGTRSPCDRLILALINYYEINGVPVQDYKPYLWGDSAANYYAVRKNKSASLWAHPTPNQILNLFDRENINQTIKNFPVTQKLEYKYQLSPILNVGNTKTYDGSVTSLIDSLEDDGVLESKTKDNEGVIKNIILKAKYDRLILENKDKDFVSVANAKDNDSVYDPNFLFPLLSHLLCPGSVASCFKLFRIGMLSVPVMGLSSHCPLMRAAAYHVLHRFCMLLDTETRHKNDKLLLSDFIETLRQSLVSAVNVQNEKDPLKQFKNPRLPALDALYLAKGLMVATAPFDPLYKPVNNFLIAKQQVDFTTVPDFLSLFHDCDVESIERRQWILQIISNGVKSISDVNVVFKTMCVKMIMDFYNSVICDRKTKEKILETIAALVDVPKAFDILYQGYGFMAWLHGVIRNLKKDEKNNFGKLLLVLINMHKSLRVNAFTNTLVSARKCDRSVVELPELKLNKDMEAKIAKLIYDLIFYIEHIEDDDVLNYIKMYNLLSKRTLKLFSKNDMLKVVSKCCKENSDCVELLKKSIQTGNPDILLSKKIDLNVNNTATFELTNVVKKYVF